jgi:hypothetical protein
MGTMSIWHWAILILYFVILGVPVARILGRVGLSRWWVLVVFLPLLNLVGLWLLAFVRWPADHDAAARN